MDGGEALLLHGFACLLEKDVIHVDLARLVQAEEYIGQYGSAVVAWFQWEETGSSVRQGSDRTSHTVFPVCQDQVDLLRREFVGDSSQRIARNGVASAGRANRIDAGAALQSFVSFMLPKRLLGLGRCTIGLCAGQAFFWHSRP